MKFFTGRTKERILGRPTGLSSFFASLPLFTGLPAPCLDRVVAPDLVHLLGIHTTYRVSILKNICTGKLCPGLCEDHDTDRISAVFVPAAPPFRTDVWFLNENLEMCALSNRPNQDVPSTDVF